MLNERFISKKTKSVGSKLPKETKTMSRSVINTVYNILDARTRGAVRSLKLSTIRGNLVKQGVIASNETIARALRRLRNEGTVQYEYDRNTDSYRVKGFFNCPLP